MPPSPSRRLDDTEREHRLRQALEGYDVGPEDVIAALAVLCSRRQAIIMNVAHDASQALLSVFKAPAVTTGVLLHLQRGGRDTACVGRLARAVGELGFDE